MGLFIQISRRVRKHGWRVFSVALRQVRLAAYRRERLLLFALDRAPCSSFQTDCQLKKFDPDLVEQIAKQYPEDTLVANYLTRAAERLSTPANAGYALCSPKSEFLSFAWVASLDGYIVEELGIHLEGRRILIFDCYTPVQHRGKKYYNTALNLVVQEYKESMHELLILCSEQNPASLKGILNAGFTQKFVVDTKVILGRVWSARIYSDMNRL